MKLQPIHRQTLMALLVGATVGHAYGQEQEPERLKLRVGAIRTEDSNFSRLPDNKAVADQINSQTLDANVDLPYGQQRFELEANLINNRHQTLTQLDFLGKNYMAGWRWTLTPTLLGALSTKHTESLNSAGDSIDPTLRNKNVTDLDNLTLGYLLGGPWHLLADYSKGTSTNERAVLGVSDLRYESYTAGISYAPNKSKSFSYGRRVDSGTNINALTGVSGYSNVGHIILVTYALNDKTSFKARLAYLEQHFSLESKYDFSGISGGVDATWLITSKTSLVGGWQRDISSFQTLDSTYAQTDTFSLTPTWQATPTLSFGLQYKKSMRDALGNPNGTASTRQDRTNDTAFNVQWQPRRYLSLRASVSQANRTSTAVDQDYNARVVTLGAQFIY
jgi:exopolysaccharide biosynthesis operon protein EpsL